MIAAGWEGLPAQQAYRLCRPIHARAIPISDQPRQTHCPAPPVRLRRPIALGTVCRSNLSEIVAPGSSWRV